MYPWLPDFLLIIENHGGFFLPYWPACHSLVCVLKMRWGLNYVMFGFWFVSFVMEPVSAVCVCVCVDVASLCFILPPGVQCFLKVRDDTVGEGSVITATFPSLHLSFHVFSSLSFVACGMWTLLNFPLGGWVMETTGGEGWWESSPSLVLSSVFSCFIPSRGLWSWGLRGEKAAQAALLLLGSVLSLIPPRSGSEKSSQKSLFSLLHACLRPTAGQRGENFLSCCALFSIDRN